MFKSSFNTLTVAVSSSLVITIGGNNLITFGPAVKNKKPFSWAFFLISAELPLISIPIIRPKPLTSITLVINLFLTLACLSLLNATLTLPGIAGVVLSIGMAVDTNVLIFERIREEYKNSKKLYNSVVSGFDFAWATIFDSNITTLLVAIVLFVLGTGAVKGFALVLGIGIFTSLFSGVLLTKLLLSTWLNVIQPKTIKMWSKND